MTRHRPAFLLLLVVIGIFVSSGTPRTQAASSNVVVTMQVPSATSLTAVGCLPGVAGRTEFGTVQPGVPTVTTSDCTVSFDSSNDTASLRVSQSDAAGRAMAMQPDRFDTSWSGDGIVETNLAPASEETTDIAVLASGAVLTVGSGPDTNVLLVRHTSTGAIDGSFGGGTGYVQLDVAPLQNERALAVDVDSSGRYLLAGTANVAGNPRMFIARTSAAGALDATFGGSGTGVRIIDPAATSEMTDIIELADGRIVTVGTLDPGAGTGRGVVYAWTSSGTPDLSVGGGTGQMAIDPTGSADSIEVVREGSGGTVVFGGTHGLSSAYVARATPSLTLDPGFGASGLRSFDTIGTTEYVGDLGFQSDGRIVAAVRANNGVGGSRLVAARLTTGGSLDTASFAAPLGYRELPLGAGSAEMAYALAVDALDRLLVAGANSARTLLVGRLLADGTVDTGFGVGGMVVSGSGAFGPVPTTAAALSGGKLYVAGSSPLNPPIRIARLGGPEVDDYLNIGGGSDRDWTGASSTELFGVCLRTLTGVGSAAHWTVDGDGTCSAIDTDPWRAVPALSTAPEARVASANTSGNAVTAGLRFGVRPALTTIPGRYEAPITFTVVAPAA